MSKPAGRLLVVGSAACRAHVKPALARVPFEIATADDPYSAALELCRRPLAYRAVVLCLNSIYREELGLISMLREHLTHIDVFLAQTDGRQAATVEAMRRGAAGLLGEDGLHRFTDLDPAEADVQPAEVEPAEGRSGHDVARSAADSAPADGPVLTPEELRALLQEQPAMPPGGDRED
ncbi:MAG: hypothetical protein RMJ35_08990 [Phycisphaerales bacterium]|nr:hypothetical protein [Phycisphaerales bacterium]